MPSNALQDLTDALAQSLADGSFVKLTLGGYHGTDKELQKILARPIVVKRVPNLSFTYRYKTRDVVKNHIYADAIRMIEEALAKEFSVATLFTTAFDMSYDGKRVKKTAATQTEPASLDHDRSKQRLIAPEGKSYLHALGVTDAKGHVKATAQDKFRQINKYVELLSGQLSSLGDKPKVMDMGSGKGYLTFALYDYMASTLKLTPHVTGVEYRSDLVSLCNNIAHNSEFKGLNFVQGSIADTNTDGIDLLIALHACDTATDDAIAKGIDANAALIVVAPCCHKQIRKEMDAVTPQPSLEFLLKHGTFMERQAEMVTDALRALILEYYGYKTKAFEFISGDHTPKNVMITASRGSVPSAARRSELLAEMARAKAQFGIRQHYLEKRLGLTPENLPAAL